VISQIFGGGGNAGAPFRNDFIEIFNGSNASINLGGWSVQYASATASTWSATPLSSVTLLPGQYYLIQESSGGSNGIALAAPDATGTIAMAAGSGKVALVKTLTRSPEHVQTIRTSSTCLVTAALRTASAAPGLLPRRAIRMRSCVPQAVVQTHATTSQTSLSARPTRETQLFCRGFARIDRLRACTL
jgi:predicted extracellular nuclease